MRPIMQCSSVIAFQPSGVSYPIYFACNIIKTFCPKEISILIPMTTSGQSQILVQIGMSIVGPIVKICTSSFGIKTRTYGDSFHQRGFTRPVFSDDKCHATIEL